MPLFTRRGRSILYVWWYVGAKLIKIIINTMEIAEFVRIGQELLKLLSENDVKIGDWKYIKLYDEYKSMRRHKVKYRFAISELAATHNISRAKVERIIRRFKKNVK